MGVEARRVDKPWGWELIWAETEQYVGKVLFVKAGESLSLQFHRVKDEAWYVQSGRAKLELGDAGEAVLNEEVVAGAGVLPLHARNRAPRDARSRTRRSSRCRRRSSTTSSASRTATGARGRPSLDTLVLRFRAWTGSPSAKRPAGPAGRPGCCATSSGRGSSSRAGARSGYRLYGLRELNQLRSLAELRRRFRVEIADVAFAARLRREPDAAGPRWRRGSPATTDALEWEQRKHERLLAA